MRRVFLCPRAAGAEVEMKEREGGFIKLHRRVLSSPVFASMSAEQRGVFTTLLLLANWKDNTILVGDQWVVVKRGELFHSLASIAKASNCGIRVVRTTIAKLMADDSGVGGNGPVLTTRALLPSENGKSDTTSDTRCRVLSFVNYCRYQDSEPRADTTTDTRPTQGRHRGDTYRRR